MKIGIDISQTAFENTGVANYLADLVENMIKIDSKNDYVLFFASLRQKPNKEFLKRISLAGPKVQVKAFPIPLTLLEILWNRLHILPIEWLIGKIDVFVTSDWIEPPSMAKKVTILYDLIVYKYPEETDKKIITTQKRKLRWVKKEVDTVICISESTKKDAVEILNLPENKLKVVYPGFTL